MPPRLLMTAAAACSLLVSLLHVYIIVEGPWAYRFFGAGEDFATLAEQGSWLPPLVTALITLVFLLFAACYLAGERLLPRRPLLRWALIGIAAIYTLRGALLIPGLLLALELSPFDIGSSLISLAIGLLHCAAAWSLLRGAPGVAGARA